MQISEGLKYSRCRLRRCSMHCSMKFSMSHVYFRTIDREIVTKVVPDHYSSSNSREVVR